MIHRALNIGRWVVDFLFATEDYDADGVLACLYDIGAPEDVMERAERIMESGRYNRGFTFSNPDVKRAVCVIGPTTSGRMDRYTPLLLDFGLRGMIGKGRRSEAVEQSIYKNNAIYMGATGGAGALLSKCIKSSEVIAYEDLGTEAVRKLYVEDFPVTVLIK